MEGAPDDKGPRPTQEAGAVETPPFPHVHSAWLTWLSALATDAEAVIAAAFAFESLPSEARDAWLDALEQDASRLDVPAVALYAPLLAVESDPARRDRIEAVMALDPRGSRAEQSPARAFLGVSRDGTHASIIVAPLYLDFVQVLSCRYTPSGGFVAVQHDPVRHACDLAPMCRVDDVMVEPAPLRVVVEELAHAILADKRLKRTTPPALASFAHLFGPNLEDCDDLEP